MESDTDIIRKDPSQIDVVNPKDKGVNFGNMQDI